MSSDVCCNARRGPCQAAEVLGRLLIASDPKRLEIKQKIASVLKQTVMPWWRCGGKGFTWLDVEDGPLVIATAVGNRVGKVRMKGLSNGRERSERRSATWFPPVRSENGKKETMRRWLKQPPLYSVRLGRRPVIRSFWAGEKFLQHDAKFRHMHGRDLPNDLQIHVGIVMRYDVAHAAHFSKGKVGDGLAGCLGQVRYGFADNFDAPDHGILFLLVGAKNTLRCVFA